MVYRLFLPAHSDFQEKRSLHFTELEVDILCVLAWARYVPVKPFLVIFWHVSLVPVSHDQELPPVCYLCLAVGRVILGMLSSG